MISNFPGDFLGESDEYDKTIMYIYVGMLDFQNMELVQARWASGLLKFAD